MMQPEPTFWRCPPFASNMSAMMELFSSHLRDVDFLPCDAAATKETQKPPSSAEQ